MTNATAATATAAGRNDDLLPMIGNAMGWHRAGNEEQRDIQICNINHLLIERGDDVDEFWSTFVKLAKELG